MLQVAMLQQKHAANVIYVAQISEEMLPLIKDDWMPSFLLNSLEIFTIPFANNCLHEDIILDDVLNQKCIHC